MTTAACSPTRRGTHAIAWRPRTTLAALAFAVAAFAPLVVGESRVADLAGGLYLACAAVGLAFTVGVAGLPLLAQGAFIAIGAVAAAHLGSTALGAVAGAVAGGLRPGRRSGRPSRACRRPASRQRPGSSRGSSRSRCSR